MTIWPERAAKLAVAAFLLPLAACSPQAAEQVPEPTAAAAAATHPVSGLEVVPVTITTANATHVVQAEVADNDESRAQGLMFRTEMGADEGMIFVYEEAGPLGFWMRNTVLPLDLIFIDADRTVINIEQGVPYNEETVLAERDGIAVLELNEGRSAELGIAPGDSVAW